MGGKWLRKMVQSSVDVVAGLGSHIALHQGIPRNEGCSGGVQYDDNVI